MGGDGYPSPVPKLPAFSPINTTPWCGKNARAAVYNLELPAYLSKPGCAASGDRQPRHPEHSIFGCCGRSRLRRELPHSHKFPQSVIKETLSRAHI